jgi:hypothetical protein
LDCDGGLFYVVYELTALWSWTKPRRWRLGSLYIVCGVASVVGYMDAWEATSVMTSRRRHQQRALSFARKGKTVMVKTKKNIIVQSAMWLVRAKAGGAVSQLTGQPDVVTRAVRLLTPHKRHACIK